jgi:hypothetical protein
LREHHDVLAIPRYIHEPVTVESRTVNRNEGPGGYRVGYVTAIFVEQG